MLADVMECFLSDAVETQRCIGENSLREIRAAAVHLDSSQGTGFGTETLEGSSQADLLQYGWVQLVGDPTYTGCQITDPGVGVMQGFAYFAEFLSHTKFSAAVQHAVYLQCQSGHFLSHAVVEFTGNLLAFFFPGGNQ